MIHRCQQSTMKFVSRANIQGFITTLKDVKIFFLITQWNLEISMSMPVFFPQWKQDEPFRNINIFNHHIILL